MIILTDFHYLTGTFLTGLFFSRLSANILHQIKRYIIPALLDEGEKQIRAFLEADFPSGISGDQAKVRFGEAYLHGDVATPKTRGGGGVGATQTRVHAQQ